MIAADHVLPICRQAQLLELSRSAVYYRRSRCQMAISH